MGYVNLTKDDKISYYGNQTSPVLLGSYKNDTGKSVLINSIVYRFGIGEYLTLYSWGSRLYGTGLPVDCYIQCDNVKSNTVTITKQIPANNGTGGYYPDIGKCEPVKFSFSNLLVLPNETVYFTLPWLVGFSDNVFIVDYRSYDVKLVTSPASYTVTYHANGGSDAPSSQSKPHGTPIALTTSKPTGPLVTLTLVPNEGTVSPASKQYNKIFDSWNTKANGSGTKYLPKANFTTDADTTLYAQYTYATVSNLPTPTRAGYSFGGWFNIGDKTQVVNGSPLYGNTSVVAKWIPSTYKVTYNANGGSNAPQAQTKYHGTDLKLTTAEPTKSVTVTHNANGGSVSQASQTISQSFQVWTTDAAGNGTRYVSGATYKANANATLYAQWNSAVIWSLPTPTRANCEFVGWYTAINGGSSVGTGTPIKNSITVYARYNYTIKYDLNGGTIGEGGTSIPNATKKHQVNLTLTGISPTKEGRTFLGWSESKTATSATYPPGGTYSKDAPATLYAVYGVKTYTVKFDLAGGTHTGGGALTQTVTHGGNATVPNNPTKANSTFKGWSGNYTNVTANTTITAMWNTSPIWILKSDKKWHSYLEQ